MGIPVLFHQILGKCLGPFQDGRIFPGTENPEVLWPQTHPQYRPPGDRPSPPPSGRSHFLPQSLPVSQIPWRRWPRTPHTGKFPRCRSAVKLLHPGALGDFPCQGMFSSAASHNQNFHLPTSLQDTSCFPSFYLITVLPSRTSTPAVGDQVDGPGQNLPLRLLHNPKLQACRRILRLYLHRFLQDNRARIRPFIHKMNRGACNFHAPPQGFLMHLQPVVAGAAERGDQGGMDVDDTVLKRIPLFSESTTRHPASTTRSTCRSSSVSSSSSSNCSRLL